MNTISDWIDYWNGKMRLCTIWDMKLAQICSAALMLILVKIFPQIMRISVWWFVAILVLCAPRVLYLFLLKKSGPPACARDSAKAASSSSG